MAWRSCPRILIDVSRRAIAADDRRDRAMNAFATELWRASARRPSKPKPHGIAAASSPPVRPITAPSRDSRHAPPPSPAAWGRTTLAYRGPRRAPYDRGHGRPPRQPCHDRAPRRARGRARRARCLDRRDAEPPPGRRGGWRRQEPPRGGARDRGPRPWLPGPARRLCQRGRGRPPVRADRRGAERARARARPGPARSSGRRVRPRPRPPRPGARPRVVVGTAAARVAAGAAVRGAHRPAPPAGGADAGADRRRGRPLGRSGNPRDHRLPGPEPPHGAGDAPR